MGIKKTFRLLAAATLLGVAAIAAASDGADNLKSLNDLRTNLMKEAREKAGNRDGVAFDMGMIERQVQAKAFEYIRGIDPTRVEPAEGMDWAQVFATAGRMKEAQPMLIKYIGTNPGSEKKFAAERILVIYSYRLKDFKTEASTFEGIAPTDSMSAIGFLSLAIGQAPRLVEVKGSAWSIRLIDRALNVAAKLKFDDSQSELLASLKKTAILTKDQIKKS